MDITDINEAAWQAMSHQERAAVIRAEAQKYVSRGMTDLAEALEKHADDMESGAVGS